MLGICWYVIDDEFNGPCLYINLLEIMSKSVTEDEIAKEEAQESFLLTSSETQEVPPQELSGDENAERSVLLSDIKTSKSNFLLSVTTIMKTVIGAGILTLPFTISELGYVLATICFIIVIFLTQISSVLLLKAKNLSKHSNYSSILYHIFHRVGFKAIGSIFILLNNIGICIAELTIFKQSIRKMIVDSKPSQEVVDAFYTSTVMIILCVALVQLPLTLARKIEKLKFMAFFGVAGIVVFVLSFVTHILDTLYNRNWVIDTGHMTAFPKDWFNAFAVIPNILLAFSYQMNFFPIYKGMINSTDSKMNKASLAAVSACGFFYYLVGILGYTIYGQSETFSANFLLSIPRGQTNPILFYLMNLSFLVSVLFSFPVMFFGARNNFIAILQLIFSKQSKSAWRQGDNIEQISSYIESNDKKERLRKAKIIFLVYTFLLYVVIVLTAIVVEDIQVVFNITGAVCSTSIGCIFPGLFYFMLVKKKNKPKGKLYYFALLFSTLMVPYAIFSIVAGQIKQQKQI